MLHLLQEALKLSEHISEQINIKNWTEVEKLQNQRKQLLAGLAELELPTGKEDLALVNQLSSNIKILVAAQLEQSDQRKDNLLNEIKNNNKSKKMQAAYSGK